MNRRVVLSLVMERQPFQRVLAADARSAAERSSIELEVLFAEGSSMVQNEQLLSRIRGPEDRRPAAIVVHAIFAGGLEHIAREALEVGITWVLISGRALYISYLHEEYPKVPIASVAVDNLEIGRLQGQQFQALLPAGGRMLYVEGPGAAASTIERRAETVQQLAGSKITVGKTVAGDWTENTGKSVTFWLGLKTAFRPDLVGCQNDSMAIGVRQAILAKHPDWTDIPFTGCDGLPDEGQRFVKEKLLQATVVRPPTTGKAIELVAGSLLGAPIPFDVVVPVQSYPSLEELIATRR